MAEFRQFNPRRVSRFKRRDSDRSGFKYFEIELIKDGPVLVSGDEFDQPPPSRVPLGGEADNSGGDTTGLTFASITDTNIPSSVSIPVFYITAAGGITPTYQPTRETYQFPWMAVSGSNSEITITAIPKIATGVEGQVLTLLCVDSAITITHGGGVNLMGSANFVMKSGMVLDLIYSSGGSVWNETSRGKL